MIARKPRTRPAAFDVYLRGGLVWEEKVLEVDVASRYLDAFFIPADQRKDAAGQAVKSCIPFQLGPLVFQRQALSPNTSVTEALIEAERQMDRSDERLSPSSHVELTSAGVPKAIWLVLEDGSGGPPSPDWIGMEGGPAISRFLPAPAITTSDLNEMRAAAAGAPRALFLRAQPSHTSPRRAELVWVAKLPSRER